MHIGQVYDYTWHMISYGELSGVDIIVQSMHNYLYAVALRRRPYPLGVSLMNGKTILIELLLAGFFAVACLKARVPATQDLPVAFGDFFRLPSRLERLRRSRWQWFAMVAFMLVLRLQEQLPLSIELMVAFLLVLFLALPVRANAVTTR